MIAATTATAIRGQLERIIETILIDRMSECVFWDGDEWAINDMASEKLSREIVDAIKPELEKLIAIEKLAMANNHPGVNVGAHSLANQVLKVIRGEDRKPATTQPERNPQCH